MAKPKQKKINLALQGGGAHGAFTWGVIDKLLEDNRLDINGLTATSAGAMNAVVYAHGNYIGGPDAAREALETFWQKVSKIKEGFGLFDTPFLDAISPFGKWEEWLSYMTLEATTNTLSPYQFNPLDINPLKDVLNEIVDFEALHQCQTTKLFVSATNVKSGKVKVFHTSDVTSDAVMASAALPHLYQAVEIDGEHYWDGGFMGNPSLWPLFYETDTADVLVVHINPIERDQVPHTTTEIMNRINEISFNASLLKEMRAIAFVQKLLSEDWLKDEYKNRLSNILYHSIRADKILDDLSIASKYNTDWTFLKELRDRGRDMAGQWLEAHYKDVGKRSSVNLHEEFLDL